jgi:hypothetical protein
MLLSLALSAGLLGPIAAPEAARLGAPVLTVTNLRHNIVAIWEVTGSSPNRNVSFFVSLSGPGPSTATVGSCANVVFDLSPNLILIGTDQADASGHALVTYPIPARAGGRSVWSQAIDLRLCQVSNMVFGIVG